MKKLMFRHHERKYIFYCCRENSKNVVVAHGTEIELCKHTGVGEVYIL
jgi:hypothetical protein